MPQPFVHSLFNLNHFLDNRDLSGPPLGLTRLQLFLSMCRTDLRALFFWRLLLLARLLPQPIQQKRADGRVPSPPRRAALIRPHAAILRLGPLGGDTQRLLGRVDAGEAGG